MRGRSSFFPPRGWRSGYGKREVVSDATFASTGGSLRFLGRTAPGRRRRSGCSSASSARRAAASSSTGTTSTRLRGGDAPRRLHRGDAGPLPVPDRARRTSNTSRGCSETVRAARIAPLADLVRMTGRLDDPVRTYSSGCGQRIGIAQALLGDPAVLMISTSRRTARPGGSARCAS